MFHVQINISCNLFYWRCTYSYSNKLAKRCLNVLCTTSNDVGIWTTTTYWWCQLFPLSSSMRGTSLIDKLLGHPMLLLRPSSVLLFLADACWCSSSFLVHVLLLQLSLHFLLRYVCIPSRIITLFFLWGFIVFNFAFLHTRVRLFIIIIHHHGWKKKDEIRNKAPYY